jgi:Flp pilus assembly protein TadB
METKVPLTDRNVHFPSEMWSNMGKERLADASKEKKEKKGGGIKMQMLINVILSAIIAVFFIFLAIPVTTGTWIFWVFGIAAAIALILSFFKPGTRVP